LKPESNAEKKLLSSCARRILFRGMHYKIDEDFPHAYEISQEDISESIKYKCIGCN